MKPAPSSPFVAPDSWIVMPMVECLDYTLRALEDCLVQDGLDATSRILLVDNGSSRETRRRLEAVAAGSGGRILAWFHNPPLGGPPFGTVCATWNRALDFCWECGAKEVLVVNNDVRLARDTYFLLLDGMVATGALFVSAVGVTEQQFSPEVQVDYTKRGGPDFSCFLISRECHSRFRFDEALTYFGDNDYHYRLKLAGEGERIFSVNVPYLHFGSRTVNRSPAVSAAYTKVFEAHRDYYIKKWGGVGGEETFDKPWNGEVQA